MVSAVDAGAQLASAMGALSFSSHAVGNKVQGTSTVSTSCHSKTGMLAEAVAKRTYQHRDTFFRKAQKEGLRARSAFKMEEMVSTLALAKPGQNILDLGAAPGGFLQILAKVVGPSGRVIGIDIVPIRPLPFPQVSTLVIDIYSADIEAYLGALGFSFHCVISDMAPKTTGIKITDEARSLALAERALELASRCCFPGGHFVAKLFMGRGFEEFRKAVAGEFSKTKIIRPKATRSASSEVYVVGLGKK